VTIAEWTTDSGALAVPLPNDYIVRVGEYQSTSALPFWPIRWAISDGFKRKLKREE